MKQVACSSRHRWGTLITLLCTSLSLMAGNKPDCPPAISFALYENGYIYDAAGDFGIDKDVVEELGRRSGCTFALTVKPRARIWHELKIGALMMTGSGVQNEERDSFAWSVRYMAQKNFVLVDSTAPEDSAARFAGNKTLRWGAVRGYKHGAAADAFLEGLRTEFRVIEEPDLGAVFHSFTRKRLTALFGPPPAYAKYVNTLGLKDKIRIEDWFPQDPPIPHALFFSKTHFSSEEMGKWRELVRQMRDDGTLKAIYRRHLGALDAERMLQFKAD